MQENIRNKQLLQSLARKGFTLYQGKKVTFAEAERLEIESQKVIEAKRLEYKNQVIKEIHEMLNNWSINEHHLTTFVEGCKKCVFLDILEAILIDKQLEPKQEYVIQELKRNLEFLSSHPEQATYLLPDEAAKLIAGSIVHFIEKSDYLNMVQELIGEKNEETIRLIKIFTGRITSEEIVDLTTTASTSTIETNSSSVIIEEIVSPDGDYLDPIGENNSYPD